MYILHERSQADLQDCSKSILALYWDLLSRKFGQILDDNRETVERQKNGSQQLVSEIQQPLPTEPSQENQKNSGKIEPGKIERYDYEYKQEGVCNLFMVFEPFSGQRHITITDKRTAFDYAHQMLNLVDVLYPEAKKITVIQDNLNTHTPASLYKAFKPAEAKGILEKLEFHYTPKHGSWRDLAEIEFSVLARQCLDRRIPDKKTLLQEVVAFQQRRNQDSAPVNWHFTTPKRQSPDRETKTRKH